MPVVLSKTVGTVCLPAQNADPDHFADIDAAVMGWGVANGADGNERSPTHFYRLILMMQHAFPISKIKEKLP